MMMLMDTGAEQILKSYFAKVEPVAGTFLTLKLFVNDITPADTDLIAAYTEATGGGYEAKTMLAADAIISGATIKQAAYPQQQFTFTGPLTTNTAIYGVYIVDADGVLICAEKAPAAYTPTNNGDMYNVTPAFQLSYGTPA